MSKNWSSFEKDQLLMENWRQYVHETYTHPSDSPAFEALREEMLNEGLSDIWQQIKKMVNFKEKGEELAKALGKEGMDLETFTQKAEEFAKWMAQELTEVLVIIFGPDVDGNPGPGQKYLNERNVKRLVTMVWIHVLMFALVHLPSLAGTLGATVGAHLTAGPVATLFDLAIAIWKSKPIPDEEDKREFGKMPTHDFLAGVINKAAKKLPDWAQEPGQPLLNRLSGLTYKAMLSTEAFRDLMSLEWAQGEEGESPESGGATSPTAPMNPRVARLAQ